MAFGLRTPHTPSPAPLDADPMLWLRLIRSRRVGPATFHKLLRDYGRVDEALAALPEIARAAGVENYVICPLAVVKQELALGQAAGAQLLLWGQEGYPEQIMDLPDAPPILWAQGDVRLLGRPKVAIVGARNASSLGIRMARQLARGLGEAEHVVVSGLARGIDAEAHRASLPLGTVAVQAGGVDVIYPLENGDLAAQIAETGCRISEQPMGLVPQARHFPQRNRIVSGISKAVVVVEAAARSGSLLTARNALDQGREVLAVPGHPLDARAAGCNILLRDGAGLIRSTNDILEAIGVRGHFLSVAREPEVEPIEPVVELPGPVPMRRGLADIAAVHGQILARLGPSPLAEDQLLRDLALPIGAAAAALVSLELEGRISRQAGGLLSRID